MSSPASPFSAEPPPDVVHHDACPLCGSSRRSPYLVRSDGVQVLVCDDCRFGYVESHPRDLGAFYPLSYYEKDEEQGVGYVHYERIDAGYFAWAIALVELAGGGKSLFDLGCTNGLFLDLAKAAGFEDVAGIEYTPEYAEIARAKGHRVVAGDFLEAELPSGGPYDVVTAWAVLEHLPRIPEAMSRVRSLLRPGGRFFFEVPCLTFEEERDAKWMNSSLEHVYYFTEASMEALCRRYFGRPYVGRVVCPAQFGASLIGFVSDAEYGPEPGAIGRRLLRMAAEDLAATSTRDLFAYLALYHRYLEDDDTTARIGEEILRRRPAAGELPLVVGAYFAHRHAQDRPQTAAFREASEYWRSQAENTETALKAARADRDHLQRELESLVSSKTVRGARLLQAARHDPRKIPLIPFRAAALLLPGSVKTPLKAVAKQLADRIDAARARSVRQKPHPEGRPLVSVVIPCFNYGSYVTSAVDSVLAQTLQDLEVIVVDGGSDESTLQVLRDLSRPRTTTVFREGRHLVGSNRNHGIERALGKYICCLDADDLLDPTYLEKAVFLAETGAYDLVYPSVQCFGDSELLWLVGDVSFEKCLAENGVPTVGLFRRDAWSAVGGYRDFGTGHEYLYEDWDFWARMLGRGFRAKSIREPLMLYRVHSRGLTSATPKSIPEHAAEIRAQNRDLLAPRWAQARRAAAGPVSVSTPSVNLARVPRAPGPSAVFALPFTIVGGADTVLVRIARDLVEAGWNVSVATTLVAPESMGSGAPAWRGVTRDVFELPKFLVGPELREQFLIHLLESRRPDVFFLVGSAFAYDLLPEIRRRFPRLRVVDQLFNAFGHLENNRRHAGSIDRHVVAEDSLRELLVSTHGQDPHTVRVIHHGVDASGALDPDTLEPASLRHLDGRLEGRPVVAFVGRFSEEKQPLAFVEIARRLRGRDDARFLMIGDGPLAPEVRARVAEAGLSSTVVLPGFVPDIRPILRAVDVLVIPSRIEGIPIVLLEALALRVPVVASRVGGIPFVVTEGENGFLREPGDLDGFAAAVARLLDSADERRELGHRGRATVLERFSERRMCNEYREVFESLRGEAGPARESTAEAGSREGDVAPVNDSP